MNSLTTVEMHNLMIEVAREQRDEIRWAVNAAGGAASQLAVDATMAELITRVSRRIGIQFEIVARDLVPKVRDEGGPL